MKRIYGGKRKVFSWDLNEERELVLRSESGNEFQMVGAAWEKDLRPIALFMLGTSSRFRVDDLRDLVGI